MNKVKKLIFSLIDWSSQAEDQLITKENILGLWRLIDFTIISIEGESRKWADETQIEK
ncbi:MAG: hypothetical protein Q8M40_02070 [Legionella sp.]|nr:hypothetical protein [Legionella sp.]